METGHTFYATYTKDQLLAATARHEAGHAVMRYLVGLPCTEISIDVNAPGNGFCAGTGRLVAPWDLLLVDLAGPVAEVYPYSVIPEGSVDEDFRHACEIVDGAFAGDRTVLAFACAEAKELIGRHFGVVATLGELLLDLQVVAAEEVAALCRDRIRRRRSVGRRGKATAR